MEDPNLILALKPINERAILAFSLPSNAARHVLPAPDVPLPDTDNGDKTPKTVVQDDETEVSGSLIRLTFDAPPKDPQRGFVFGSDPDVCDVILGTPKQGISKREFRITLDQQGRPVLEAVSQSHTMTVSYGSQGKGQDRHFFRWILFQGTEIIVTTSHVRIQVVIANHRSCEAEYRNRLLSFLKSSHDAVASLGFMNIRSAESTAAPSRPMTPPRQAPIYFKVKKLGEGGFGTVYKTIDVSTGSIYAAKQFDKGQWQGEVDTLKRASHEYIVPFVDFTNEVEPLLVMELLPLGSLDHQHADTPITISETLTLLTQGLRALDYLHSSLSIVHRDIKPANILLATRTPFHIKLADFGLAKGIENSTLLTQCGTPLYSAPEVSQGSAYTTDVDIWSLGVVVFEYGYGLPHPDNPFHQARWCEKLVLALEDREQDDLTNFLCNNMMREVPDQRLSAWDCLQLSQTIVPQQETPGARMRMPRREMGSAQRGRRRCIPPPCCEPFRRVGIPGQTWRRHEYGIPHISIARRRQQATFTNHRWRNLPHQTRDPPRSKASAGPGSARTTRDPTRKAHRRRRRRGGHPPRRSGQGLGIYETEGGVFGKE
ncbi:hypothetical protein MMC30_002924 [Trapelia coarctata]|nr:hypothetical protein [Trapelia coarctata]